MKIEVLVCTISGEQHMEQREVPMDWFESARKEMPNQT